MARSSGSSFRRSFSASVSTTSAAASSPARPHGHPPSAPAAPGYPPSTRPSPEYLQHFDVVAPEISTRILRPGWLHRTRLLQLRETDLIDEATLDTALTWRRDHDRAHASDALTSGFTPKIDSSRTGSPVLRLDALRRLREAAAALGPWRTLLLERLVVHDDSSACAGPAAALLGQDGAHPVGRSSRGAAGASVGPLGAAGDADQELPPDLIETVGADAQHNGHLARDVAHQCRIELTDHRTDGGQLDRLRPIHHDL